ncbi:MAG: enoyl-CoA hydratase/isomerase family protein [Rhizobiaceae bacterium]|nr:enoyl-CoA hydratase/isomerase family protein [Rhizobiaceae bacterium]
MNPVHNSEYDTIALDIGGPIARITLDRPDKLNALNPAMLEELLDALAKVRRAPGVNALFLEGTGRVFSAGVDLDTPFFMEHVEDKSVYSGSRLLDWQHEVITAIFEQDILTVAALNGHACGGGGLGLAMACDLRISVRTAQFWMVPLKLDVIQDFGLSWMIQRLVGPSRAIQMAVLGERVDAETALNWGLVNEIVDDAEALASRMEALANQIGDMGTDALKMMKVILRSGERSELRPQLHMEAIANGLNFQSDEFAQKKSAYLARTTGARK